MIDYLMRSGRPLPRYCSPPRCWRPRWSIRGPGRGLPRSGAGNREDPEVRRLTDLDIEVCRCDPGWRVEAVTDSVGDGRELTGEIAGEIGPAADAAGLERAGFDLRPIRGRRGQGEYAVSVGDREAGRGLHDGDAEAARA